MGWVSSLNRKPQYVKAIGMISIENGNLEIALADLMAAILRIQRDVPMRSILHHEQQRCESISCLRHRNNAWPPPYIIRRKRHG